MLQMDGLAVELPKQLSGFGRPDSRKHLTNGVRNKDFINQTQSEPITASLRSSGLAGRAARVEISPLQSPCSLCLEQQPPNSDLLSSPCSREKPLRISGRQSPRPEGAGSQIAQQFPLQGMNEIIIIINKKNKHAVRGAPGPAGDLPSADHAEYFHFSSFEESQGVGYPA